LLALAVATSAFVFVTNALPVFTGQVRGAHPEHWGWVVLHALTGTAMIITAPLNLYIGETRRWFGWHRHVGCVYLGAGYTAATAAIAVNLRDPHAVPMISVATTMLAVAWLLAATLAWRAASNKRFPAHRDWMIRSYVLTWSFVLCRLVQRSDVVQILGEEGVGVVVWLTWLVPFLAAEAALQWRATGPRKSPAGNAPEGIAE
jgi:hypothetical protein